MSTEEKLLTKNYLFFFFIDYFPLSFSHFAQTVQPYSQEFDGKIFFKILYKLIFRISYNSDRSMIWSIS